MSSYVGWFVLSFGLLAAELLSGTFYLLVLAVALAAAGLTALLGLPVAVQLSVAAAIGLIGSFWLRRSKANNATSNSESAPVQHLDVGQSVQVQQWAANRTARANYRGALWDIELAAGDELVAGEFVIQSIQGNRLIVTSRR